MCFVSWCISNWLCFPVYHLMFTIWFYKKYYVFCFVINYFQILHNVFQFIFGNILKSISQIMLWNSFKIFHNILLNVQANVLHKSTYILRLHHGLTGTALSRSGHSSHNYCSSFPGISAHVSFDKFLSPVPLLLHSAPYQLLCVTVDMSFQCSSLTTALVHLYFAGTSREKPRYNLNALLALFLLICLRQEEIISGVW